MAVVQCGVFLSHIDRFGTPVYAMSMKSNYGLAFQDTHTHTKATWSNRIDSHFKTHHLNGKIYNIWNFALNSTGFRGVPQEPQKSFLIHHSFMCVCECVCCNALTYSASARFPRSKSISFSFIGSLNFIATMPWSFILIGIPSNFNWNTQ